ncbi:MAG: porin [Verrucomicrobiales bacterium]
MKDSRNTPTLLLVLTAVFLVVKASLAGEIGGFVINDKNPTVPDNWALCNFLEHPEIYENWDNPVIQKLSLSGRVHVDVAFFDAHEEDFNSLLWRRVRKGFAATLFEDFRVVSQVEFDLNDLDPAYSRISDAYISWSKSDEFEIKVGKQAASFTLDGATSSNSLIRPERSVLSSNLWFPELFLSGISASGEIGNWYYNVAGFSSSINSEFGDFDGGNFGIFSIGYDYTDFVPLDKAVIRFDYVNQQEHSNNNGTRDFAQLLSLNGQFEKGPWGIWTDVAFGDGYRGQDDVFGLQLMPFYNVTDKLQLVASYNYLKGRGDNSVRFDRYESRIESGRADEMHEFFAGVNYYFCGHKLKWQNGVEYTTAKDRANDGGDYDGWGFTSGIRMSW